MMVVSSNFTRSVNFTSSLTSVCNVIQLTSRYTLVQYVIKLLKMDYVRNQGSVGRNASPDVTLRDVVKVMALVGLELASYAKERGHCKSITHGVSPKGWVRRTTNAW